MEQPPVHYHFTQQWFYRSELHALASQLLGLLPPDQPHSFLEIGCFEGLSACFWSDHFLGHPRSSLVCVDPFLPSPTVSEQTLANFRHNIQTSSNAVKVTFHRETSQAFFRHNQRLFDFIYIDGSHEPADIQHDMEQGWAVLLVGGLMWMDDYLGGKNDAIKTVMDDWCQQHRGEWQQVWSGYQLGLLKK
jgi:predicted O-methyltransferase YrrM